MPTITVYGTGWCPDVRRARSTLDASEVDYEFIDIDIDQEAEKRVLEWNAGRRRVPTIVIDDDGRETVLSNPPRHELQERIESLMTAGVSS